MERPAEEPFPTQYMVGDKLWKVMPEQRLYQSRDGLRNIPYRIVYDPNNRNIVAEVPEKFILDMVKKAQDGKS